ncbi:MAG: glycerophosphodiester phosphodiesterase [Methanobacteriota archaeon]|nr:MAG: glycerophosphodiester phosphodiesterase [Euryarchaeota archaeon]
MDERHMEIIAHRGLDKPENTLQAFRKAIEAGFPYVELDVHRTIDNQWVVIHDFEVEGLEVESSTYSQIKNLFSDDERPPLLEEVIEIKELKLNIELKVPRNHDDPRTLGQSLQKFLSNRLSEERYNLSSFNYKGLIGARTASKDVKLSYLSLRPNLKKWEQLNRKLKGLYSVNPLFLLLRKKHVDRMHRHGIKIHPWTVNRDKWIKRMIKLGVDGIITDKPKRVETILHQVETS